MKNAKRTTTIGKMVWANVKVWITGITFAAALIAAMVFGFRREVIETMKAEVLKEECFALDTGDDIFNQVAFDAKASDNYIKRLYKRNGSVMQYEVRGGTVRCWVEFYSGWRVEITGMGWLIN